MQQGDIFDYYLQKKPSNFEINYKCANKKCTEGNFDRRNKKCACKKGEGLTSLEMHCPYCSKWHSYNIYLRTESALTNKQFFKSKRCLDLSMHKHHSSAAQSTSENNDVIFNDIAEFEELTKANNVLREICTETQTACEMVSERVLFHQNCLRDYIGLMNQILSLQQMLCKVSMDAIPAKEEVNKLSINLDEVKKKLHLLQHPEQPSVQHMPSQQSSHILMDQRNHPHHLPQDIVHNNILQPQFMFQSSDPNPQPFVQPTDPPHLQQSNNQSSRIIQAKGVGTRSREKEPHDGQTRKRIRIKGIGNCDSSDEDESEGAKEHYEITEDIMAQFKNLSIPSE